ncbi:MAG: hypothetical protein ACXACI_12760 [Candidatus Hodarchaeales archaeon]|jgi:hypothetical protein
MTTIEESRQALEDKFQQFLVKVDEEIALMNTKAEEASTAKGRVGELEAQLSETIQEQLSRVSSLYEEASKEHEETQDLSELLGIYITLLEEVFAGRPHAKILYLIHGDKEVWTRGELNKTTGFTAVAILRALHELAAAELIDYNEETNEVRVTKRIY